MDSKVINMCKKVSGCVYGCVYFKFVSSGLRCNVAEKEQKTVLN